MRRKRVVTLTVLAIVLILAIWIMNRPMPNVDKAVAECIGLKSTLYIQLGCSACETQERLFGDSYQYLNVIDCFFESEKCLDVIKRTPTWEIGNELIEGVQSIPKLQELTGCE